MVSLLCIIRFMALLTRPNDNAAVCHSVCIMRAKTQYRGFKQSVCVTQFSFASRGGLLGRSRHDLLPAEADAFGLEEISFLAVLGGVPPGLPDLPLQAVQLIQERGVLLL